MRLLYYADEKELKKKHHFYYALSGCFFNFPGFIQGCSFSCLKAVMLRSLLEKFMPIM